MLPQELRRIVCRQRRRPHRPAGEHPGGAAAARGLDRNRERGRIDALREHDPRARNCIVDPPAPRADLVGRPGAVGRDLALVEVASCRRELARGLDDRGLAVEAVGPADDAFEHGEQTVGAGELDEARRGVEAVRPALVVAPDHEQLQRHRARARGGGRVHVFVELGVLDGAAGRLLERVGGEDQAARVRYETLLHDRVEPVLAVDEEPRRVRRELARDRELERDEPLVRNRRRMLMGEHRAQRLALVHRDHEERAALAREGVECHAAASPSAARSTQISAFAHWWTMLAGQSGSKRSRASTRRVATRLFVPWRTRRTRCASREIVPRPIETPWRGTSSREVNSGNVARLSRRVLSASSITAVRPSRAEPGGTNATWPSDAPEASRKRAMPPAVAMRPSYASGSLGSGSQTLDSGSPSGAAISRSANPRQL